MIRRRDPSEFDAALSWEEANEFDLSSEGHAAFGSLGDLVFTEDFVARCALAARRGRRHARAVQKRAFEASCKRAVARDAQLENDMIVTAQRREALIRQEIPLDWATRAAGVAANRAADAARVRRTIEEYAQQGNTEMQELLARIEAHEALDKANVLN